MPNHNLFDYAIAVGNKMSAEYISKGDYYPEEAWGCEGQIYPSLMGLMLLELYKVEPNEQYINAVKSIIEKNIEKQMPSGGWALSLGAVANGIKFEVSEHIKEITANCEDLPPTATAIRLLAEYQLLTNDSKYVSSLEKGFNYLLKFWNTDKLYFDEMLVGEALKLRANPKNYQIYAYQCIESIANIYPEANSYKKPLYNSIKTVFEDMDADTYPLLYALYACLIIEKERTSNYVTGVIKEKIIKEIALESIFSIPNVPGAMGHRDGLRGICLGEGHLRNSVGAALVMMFYDTYVEKGTFTKLSFYEHTQRWILQMFEKGRFYEFIDFKTNSKMGVGTPGQYIPLMWILNKI
jgi:hypothetical protein